MTHYEVLVVGTAKPEHVECFLSRTDAEGCALLISERDRERFQGRVPKLVTFTGTMRWFNRGLLTAFLRVRPRRVVIVCGLAYDHANVAEAVQIVSRFVGCNAEFALYVGDSLQELPEKMSGRRAWLEIFCLPLLACIAGVLVLLRPWRTIRVGSLYSRRLGHIAMDCEIYLCERDLGICPPCVLDFFYTAPGLVANRQLVRMFQRHMRIWPLVRYVKQAVDLFQINARHEIVITTHQISYCRDVRCLMQQVDAHLQFTREEEIRGREGLVRLGVDPQMPRVCLFGRDPLYLDLAFGGLGDGKFQEPRNMDIQTYGAAAVALAELGYAVIRMGSVVKEPLRVLHPLVFDYATSGIRDDFLDIYLAATCRFFVGAPSGLAHIPMIFRVPCVYVNLVRLEFLLFCEPLDITIFKRMRRVGGGFLSVFEAVSSGLSRSPIEHIAQDEMLELVDNTPEEIREAVMEMHQRLEGVWVSDPADDALQTRFRNNIPISKYNSALNSRVGAFFLRRHADTLIPEVL
jgi:putative glycosyltransferase (TIGR04372 family)